MAEGWANHLHAGALEACSAGTSPHGLNPMAVRAMAEVGIDISHHRSNTIEDNDPETLDLVVTVCGHAHETCPVFPGSARVMHKSFDDPPRLAVEAESDDEAMGHYRRVRDEIRAFVQTLPESIGAHVQNHA